MPGQRAAQLRLHRRRRGRRAWRRVSRQRVGGRAPTGSVKRAVELRQRRLQHAHRHRGGDELRHLQPVLARSRAAVSSAAASQAMLTASAGTLDRPGHFLRRRRRRARRPAAAARSARARLGAAAPAGRPCPAASTRTFISRAVVLRSVSIALNWSPSRTSGGRPDEHLQVLRDADAGAAGAELLHAGVGDGDELEARQRVVERHLDRPPRRWRRARRSRFHTSSVSNSSRVAPRPPPPPAATALRP